MAAKKTSGKVEKSAEKSAAPKTPRRRRPAKAPERPALVAGIDIGSTAVRMNISEFPADGDPRILEELSHPVPTGSDTFQHGRILPDTVRTICRVLKNFLQLMDDYGVVNRRVVASSAVREASNSEILVDRIRHESGLALEILDAVEESRFAYRALQPWLERNPGSYSMAMNLGGGSTEIMILRGEDLQMGGVRRLGTSRLYHAIGHGVGQARAEMLQAMAANIVNSTRDAYQDYAVTHLYLINRILYRAFRSDPAAEKGNKDFVISSERLRERLTQAYSASPLDVGRRFNMGLADVEQLITAMLILDCFVRVTEVAEVTFTNTEMLNGLVREMHMALRGENPLMSFHRQMVRSARAVGEKYFYDRTHARVVTGFSLTLFDALRELLDLTDQDRLLLEVASLLHDIGMFVAEQDHHKHGAYLVEWADIVGLNEADRYLVSRIVYFHRLEMPSREHPDFMALPMEDRVRVRKLAGILRLADVLDRGHSQEVTGLEVEAKDEKLVLYLQITKDLGLILDALPKKADLLETVTGLDIVLRREMPRV